MKWKLLFPSVKCFSPFISGEIINHSTATCNTVGVFTRVCFYVCACVCNKTSNPAGFCVRLHSRCLFPALHCCLFVISYQLTGDSCTQWTMKPYINRLPGSVQNFDWLQKWSLIVTLQEKLKLQESIILTNFHKFHKLPVLHEHFN